MARKTTAKADETNTISAEEALLLKLADTIYAAFSNSGAVAAPVAAPAPAEEPEEAPEVDEEPETEDAAEVDAEEDVDLEAERAKLTKLTIAALRKQLIAAGYDAAEVKAEKDKAALVETLLDEMYGEDDDEEDEEDDIDDEPEADEAEDDVEDDEDDESDESDDEDDEDDEPYTEEELDDLSLGELKEIASEWELEISKGARSKTYVKAILEAQEADEDDDADEDEEGEEDEREDLEKLTLAELRKVAKDDYGLTAREVKGLDKDGILDLIFDDEDEEEE